MARPSDNNADIVVIGSGPIGVGVARRLAERGRHVTILEAGAAITDPPGAHLRNGSRFRAEPDAFFGAVQPYLAPTCPSQPDNPTPGLADSALVGGQGVLWTNNCPRFSDFERWEAMTADEWDRWFADAEAMLLVEPDAAAASRTGAALRDRLAPALAADGRALRGLPLSGSLRADGSVHYAAPHDILAAAEPAARGRIVIRPGVTATRLHHRAGRVARVDLAEADGADTTLSASAVILAGGAIATPRLLARSGLGGSALGRGLSFHAIMTGQAVLDGDGVPTDTDDDIAARLWIPPTPRAPWHIQIGRDTCLLPPSEPVGNRHRLVDIRAFVPAAFRDDNALLFDRTGAAAVRFAFCDADRANMAAMAADIDALVARLGHWRGGCEPRWSPHGNAHPVGTCRMDRPGWPGVADPLGRAHGLDNLWLATTGLIPAPFAVNPTLTGMALALRSCDAIAG